MKKEKHNCQGSGRTINKLNTVSVSDKCLPVLVYNLVSGGISTKIYKQ